MSDIPEPKFAVGEEVLVYGMVTGKFHGESIIQSVHRVGAGTIGPGGGSAGFWEYFISPDPSGRPDLPNNERSLKKKHKPGDSFDKIISDLKQPIKEKA